MTDELLRLPRVKEMVGLGKSEIYDRIRKDTFPRSRRISSRLAVWYKSEVEAWITETQAALDGVAR